MSSRMQEISIFEGNELKNSPPILREQEGLFFLVGIDSQGKYLRVPLSNTLLSKHILFLGSIGSGKTNGIFQIVSQIRKRMTVNDVVVIFDTKGDYYDTFYRRGDIVISSDDKATGPGYSDYWNLFNEISIDSDIEENVMEIARSLFYEKSKRSHQPFFPNAARDIFAGLLLHFYRTSSLDERNNARLRAFLNEASPSKIKELLQQHNDLKAMINYIADSRSPQTQGVISELQQLVREIFVGNFRREGTLSMRQLIRNKGGKVIFVEYDLGIGNVLAPIYRLLLDMALKEALSRKKSEGNVWFIIDEFRLIPNLQHIDDGVNFGRSLGVKFIIGVQNVEQVFHSYGEYLARSILAGFSTIIAFRVNDTTTRNFIQQLFGKNRKKEVYMSSVHSRGIVEQVREANVVEDWDILNLPVGKAIIGLPGYSPFFFQFKKFRQK